MKKVYFTSIINARGDAIIQRKEFDLGDVAALVGYIRPMEDPVDQVGEADINFKQGTIDLMPKNGILVDNATYRLAETIAFALAENPNFNLDDALQDEVFVQLEEECAFCMSTRSPDHSELHAMRQFFGIREQK